MSVILIGGGTGFVGSHLSAKLRRDGHEVRHLSRKARPDSAYPTYVWDVNARTVDDTAFQDVDYVINLAGAGIADARWTDERKALIISSRVNSNMTLAEAFERVGQPKLFLSASAIGFYGDRGTELMKETDAPGNGFLSKSCVDWEASAHAVAERGVPTFINRTGIVLHPDEGALQKMLIPLNFFTSTYFGDGQQYYSWVHIEDLVNIYVHAIENNLTGTYNGAAPNPVRNKLFAEALGPAMGKKAIVMPAPVPALKLALGEMSHTVLDSCRCSAAKIEGAGYRFRYPELSQALEQLLG